MQIITSNHNVRIKPIDSLDYREEIYIDTNSAIRWGVSDSAYGILKFSNDIPDLPKEEFPVRLVIKELRVNQENTLYVPAPFYDRISFKIGQEWELWKVKSHAKIDHITLEQSVEFDSLKNELSHTHRRDYVGRHLLVQPGQTIEDLSLRVSEREYLNIKRMVPNIINLKEPMLISIHDQTEINLFVPHRKGGIDMVVIIDASNSMGLKDYVDKNGQVETRLQGAVNAVETLIMKRLISGSRVAKFALVGFAAAAKVIFPDNIEQMVELSAEELEIVKSNVYKITRKIGDRNGSDIPSALDVAAELLFTGSREDNEKVIVLLSDGATWSQQKDQSFQVEVHVGSDDPVMFADSLYAEEGIRIHTIAISNEYNIKKYEPRRYQEDLQRSIGEKVWTPNLGVLQEMSKRSRGIFIESPDAEYLSGLFEELGEGATFPL